MPEPEFVFELPVIALDPPAPDDGGNHLLPPPAFGGIAEPVMARFIGSFGPLDDQPFLVTRPVSAGGAHAGKMRELKVPAVP